jgi:hypothetical protein
MQKALNRRELLRYATYAGLASLTSAGTNAEPRPRRLFDGRTLRGWIQLQNCQYAFSAHDILDASTVLAAIAEPRNSVGALLAVRIGKAGPTPPIPTPHHCAQCDPEQLLLLPADCRPFPTLREQNRLSALRR